MTPQEKKYRDTFMRALNSLIGDKPLPTKYSQEWKTMKDLAHESARQTSPLIGDCVIEFRQQAVCLPPKTPEAAIGKTMINVLGSAIANLTRSRKDMPKMKQTNDNDGVPAGSESHGGLTGQYQVMADLSDRIPPDNIVAFLTRFTVDGVSSARKSLRDDGYEFEREAWPGMTRFGAWKVTGRPPEPEPEPPPKPMSQLELLEKQVADMQELMAALVRQANRAD